MKIEITLNKCQDLGSPSCLEEPDERYTMRFDDLGEEPILFCASCGPRNHRIMEALEASIATGGKNFVDKLGKVLDDVIGKNLPS